MKPLVPFSVSIVSSEQALPNSISEGSSVFVRVLAHEGNGRYTVSFAGRRFSVFSQRVLENGSSFRATVNIDNGKVLLVPGPGFYDSNGPAKGVQHFSSFEQDSGGALRTFLEQLGLPADSLSFRLVQFFRENGLRFNKTLALKARSAAKRFADSEEDAAEAALFLLQKGLEADESNIRSVLALLSAGDDSRHGGGFSFTGGDTDEDKTQPGKKDIISDSLVEKVYKNAHSCLSVPAGLLTFLNHYKTSDTHWILLPFDYRFGDKGFNGVIRVLLNLKEKKAEKIVISAFSPIKNYFFVLYLYSSTTLKNKMSLDIEYCMEPPASSSEREQYNRLLSGAISEMADGKIRYRQDLLCSGCFTSSPSLSIVEVSV